MQEITNNKQTFTPVGIYNQDSTLMGERGKFIPRYDICIVFKGKKNYLYVAGDDSLKYTSFAPIDWDRVLKNVRFFKDMDCITAGVKSLYSVGDMAIRACEYEKNKVFIGTIDKYAPFALEHISNNSYYEYDINKIERERTLYKKYIKEDK